MEQISHCVIFVDLKKLVLCEEFLRFILAQDKRKDLAILILKSFKQFDVELKFLHEQEYDGATAMSGNYNGVKSHIRKI